jgi:hypothetical protein
MNTKTVLDTIEVKDLEDNSTLVATVYACTELGNKGVTGIQVLYQGNFVNFEPLSVERWAYQAQKAGTKEFLLQDYSWNVHADQFIRNYLILGDELKVRVEVKSRSKAKPVVRDFPLPFKLEE